MHFICPSGGAIVLVVWTAAQGGTVLHVDDDAPPGGDGISWNTAYRFLQDALADAANAPEGAVLEIRVAQGTYAPDRDESNPAGTGDRESSFQLIDGVTVLGGFAGIGAADPDERHVEAHATVLCGDLLGDDGPGLFDGNADNCYSVVTAGGMSRAAVLDGVVITAGNADGDVGSPLAWRVGAGIWNQGGSPTIANCTVRDNYALRGGGMTNRDGGSPLIVGCEFSGNVAVTDGGGMSNRFGASPMIVNCTFKGNQAGHVGGGLHARELSDPVVTNCLFAGNSARLFGGAVRAAKSASPTIVNCTFSGNSASFGGGIAAGSDAPDLVGHTLLRNCILAHNTAPSGPEIALAGSFPADMTVEHCDVTGGPPGVFVEAGFTLNWGAGNVDADPLFVDPAGGDYRLSAASPCIDAGHNWAVAALADTDLDGAPRFADAIQIDAGCGFPVIVDMGPYELQGAPFALQYGDIDGSGAVGIGDFLIVLGSWGACRDACCVADLDMDEVIGIGDFLIVLGAWE